jgi:S-formylglutathione hydrolase FrmB
MSYSPVVQRSLERNKYRLDAVANGVNRLSLPLAALVVTVASLAVVPTATSQSSDTVWESEGYGLVIRTDDLKMTAYQVTSVSCLRWWSAQPVPAADTGAQVFDRGDAKIRLSSGPQADRAEMQEGLSISRVILRRIAGLPSRCATPLIGPETLSGGETFAMALMERRPTVSFVGENTQGVFSDVWGRRLPNGWTFAVPTELYLTKDGKSFDATGVPPHIRAPALTPRDVERGRDPALEAAVKALKAQNAQVSDVTPAIVVRVPSAALGREQSATILLPSTYSASRRRYPVLYLLHGGGQDHTAFAKRGWFRAQAAQEMIVVTPMVGDSWYVNSVADPTARFEDFVANDLIAYVDSHYRTVAAREGRAIAGVSMGGWGAMLLGLKHPQLFGTIGALSAPFGISRQDPNMDMTSRTQQRFGTPDTPERRERDPASLVAAISLDAVPMLYLACGNEDLFVGDNRGFVQRLTARKIPYEYRELSPFGHSWDLWDPQLVTFIETISKRWGAGR